MEYRHAECAGIFHLVYKAFIPYWIECARFCSGSFYELFINIYRDIRIDELIAESAECHRMSRLKIRRSQAAGFADFQTQGTRKHFPVLVIPVFSVLKVIRMAVPCILEALS